MWRWSFSLVVIDWKQFGHLKESMSETTGANRFESGHSTRVMKLLYQPLRQSKWQASEYGNCRSAAKYQVHCNLGKMISYSHALKAENKRSLSVTAFFDIIDDMVFLKIYPLIIAQHLHVTWALLALYSNSYQYSHISKNWQRRTLDVGACAWPTLMAWQHKCRPKCSLPDHWSL